MADSIKTQFRSTSGLDAANEKVINVAKADRNNAHDAVNVEFFNEENTIQTYDSSRGYPVNFAVIYDNRIWVSNREITTPSGDFISEYWTALRTDAKYNYINSEGRQLKSGDFISSDTSNSELNYTLPSNPQDGDTIILQDVGGNVGVFGCSVKISNHRINFNSQQLVQFNVTNPYTRSIFIFSNKLWQLFITSRETFSKQVFNSGGNYQAQSGDKLVARFSGDLPLTIKLPKYANAGDTISLIDIESKEPINHVEVLSFDENTSVDSIGVYSKEYRLSGESKFIFDSSDKVWRFWTSDIRSRNKILQDDTLLKSNSSVTAFGDSTVKRNINMILPSDPADGDFISINLNYLKQEQYVTIKCDNNAKILINKNMTQFPRRTEYINETKWFETDELTYNSNDYTPILEFSYVQDSNTWVVTGSYPRVERVDNLDRERLGVIALASQDQANADKSASPEKELAITPETLSNRTATENRQGISAIANSSQVNKDSTDVFDDLTFVTPKKLNERTATETRRGLAEIATQDETDRGLDDSTIITPLKLDKHRANENMAGVLPVVRSGGKKSEVNDRPGTGIFNWEDNSTAVTPKALREIKSSEQTQGTIFVASETEVIDAPADIEDYPLAVTPEKLHKKTATEQRIGFSQIASDYETKDGKDDFKYVTPKKLNDRKSTEYLDGIIRISNQEEFNAGEDDSITVTPKKIKTYFNTLDRVIVDRFDGLTQEGTIWNGVHFSILNSSESQRGTASIASQGETNTGENDTKIITPKKLHEKKATESAEGIVKISDVNEIVLGESNNTAVSPRNLKYVMQEASSWEASTQLRGTVKISENSITFIGNNIDGSTAELDSYVKSGYAISPYELNKTLLNYLPLNATAANSDLLGGFASEQYVRSDIDQTINGKILFKGDIKINADIMSTGTAEFKSVKSNGLLAVTGEDATVEISGENNNWKLYAGNNTSELILSAAADVMVAKTDGNIIFKQSLDVNNIINSKNGLVINNVPVIIPENDTLHIGSKTNKVDLFSPDASSIKITDPSGSYNIINSKNASIELSNDFVRRNADSVITGQITNTMPRKEAQSQAVNASFINTTEGTFTVEVDNSGVYSALPGYAVPIIDSSSGNPVVVSYNYVSGPGILSQFGTSKNNKYQIWAPRPTDDALNNNAQTFWVRNWNSAKNSWDTFGRMYTSNNPPTANDIGAVATAGSAFDNLTIRDYLQIGHVIIRPDETTRTVTFEWVD